MNRSSFQNQCLHSIKVLWSVFHIASTRTVTILEKVLHLILDFSYIDETTSDRHWVMTKVTVLD